VLEVVESLAEFLIPVPMVDDELVELNQQVRWIVFHTSKPELIFQDIERFTTIISFTDGMSATSIGSSPSSFFELKTFTNWTIPNLTAFCIQ
jgi:hypothetical protein